VSDPRVAIIGATGAVGRVALQILEERNFPMDALRLTASHRSIGKTLTYKGQELVIEETTPKLLAESDIAFVSANDDISAELGELGPQQGCIVIDDSGVWRMDPAVPLVVPEVNADDIDWHAGLLAIPNCSTTPLAMALAALGANNPIKRVIASTTCVRVPVPISHSEAVHVEFELPMDPAEARKLLAAFPGIIVTDDPANAEYPMPIHAAGRDETFVGRIRKDTSNPNGLVMWIVSDNLRKGAATNAIQIAEEIVKRDVWLRERA
jgi:aspartate-semialdehyde dehydrogenase